jgi:hypothetical protein
MSPQFLTPPEACALLLEEFGIRRTPSSLAKLRVTGGNAPPYRKVNRRVYYAVDDLREWAIAALGMRHWTTHDCAGAHPRDRAGVAATAIMQIVNTVAAADQHELIETLLRDEFAELGRQVAAEREGPDA